MLFYAGVMFDGEQKKNRRWRVLLGRRGDNNKTLVHRNNKMYFVLH
jgi:hypothetical protein